MVRSNRNSLRFVADLLISEGIFLLFLFRYRNLRLRQETRRSMFFESLLFVYNQKERLYFCLIRNVLVS